MQSRRCVSANFLGMILVLLFFAGVGCSHAPERKEIPTAELTKMRVASDDATAKRWLAIVDTNLVRIRQEVDDYNSGKSAEPACVDILVLSGGGDWGAFGAGFLKGWGKVQGPLKRPRFDVVTGVSTGALIAPFAYVNTDDAIDQVVHLYRNPASDFVVPRGLFTFLMGSESYATIPGLERSMDEVLTDSFLRQVADEGKNGRVLVVSATNLDYDESHVWEMSAEADRALQSKNSRRFRDILLASSAVPGAFPPRIIDDRLYIDGGISGNILYGGRISEKESFLYFWHRKYPTIPPPKIRFWVIFNNEVHWPPAIVQPEWYNILAVTSTTATRSATLNAMRHLFSLAELARLRYGVEFEVRYTSVPDGWIAPKPGIFQKETMNALADMGEKMGADPDSWKNEPP